MKEKREIKGETETMEERLRGVEGRETEKGGRKREWEGWKLPKRFQWGRRRK